MTTLQDIEQFFHVAKNLALDAGEIIKKSIKEQKKLETQSSETDIIRKYNKEVENILFENLSKEFPGHKFIGEKISAIDEENIPELTDSPTWIIDPIDGSTNLIHTFPQCCISIGLAIDKKIVTGIIYNPFYDEMYTAIKGKGAFLNGKSIRTSSVKELKKALVNFEPINNAGFRDITLARFTVFLDTAIGVRMIGSASLAFAYVARGAIDVLQVDRLKPWNVAAGFLILTEAGGTVIDSKGGEPFDFMSPTVIATSTKALARETLKLIIETDLKTKRKRFSSKK